MIGARYSADTFRLRDFLTKNSVIYTYYDYHENADIQALLDKFQIGENDLLSCQEKLPI